MISINLFAKCPYTAETKTRMKNFLSNEERIFLSKTMLVYILDEMNKIRSNINKNITSAYDVINIDLQKENK